MASEEEGGSGPAFETCGGLDPLFPRTGKTAEARLDAPVAIVVQAVPTAVVALAWLALEAVRRRRSLPRVARLKGLLLGIAHGGVLGLLAWRIFDLLDCAGVGGAEMWRLVGVGGAPVVATGMLLLVKRIPRTVAALALLCAGGSVAAEWAVRTRVTPVAGEPFAAVQHAWLFFAVVAFGHLPARRVQVATPTAADAAAPKPTATRAPRKKTTVTHDVVVDALATRRPRTPATTSQSS
jgi:hypothetical protein